MSKVIAVIRVRGKTGVNRKINDTLDMMRLYRQNGCVVVPNTPAYRGMLHKAKDYITWGEIDKETFLVLLGKRGKVVGGKPLTDEYLKNNIKMDMKTFVEEVFSEKANLKSVPGVKPYFKLSPPIKGFERGGIKRPFAMGGVLGYRKDKINDLIRRMI